VLARKYALDALRGTVAVTVFAFFSFVPMYTVLMLLGEPLHWNLALGLALVTLGILFGVRSSTPAPVLAVPRPGL
jgi:drug/metabolite transporter (DMT)-like permease